MNSNDSWVKAILVGCIIMLIAMIVKSTKLLIIGFPIVCFSWMWLGALKQGRVRGVLKYGLISLLIIWWGGFFAMTAFDMSKLNGFVLGFPKATAIMIYVVWLLPLFTGTWLFGKRFKQDYLSDKDIEEFNKKTGCYVKTETENLVSKGSNTSLKQ
ncbi:hypothetical protein OW763_13235 [Clostridium aestuarii]|uniref:Uncharacterized protein n=1 Tax=Clostridium aestuarii TaxID=338193 RepID=A0ABT4D217_9CLOT|nr:hypothetical protein [Clostridium aestuarii]MCY6485297.1 hypothetical protein [Clostridium aestuarii]